MFKKIFTITVSAVLLFQLNTAVNAAENVLKNGAFTEMGGDEIPKGWNLYSPTQKCSIDSTDKPGEAVSSLRIEVKKGSGGDGYLRQKVKLNGQGRYKISGSLKATTPRGAYLQVKLVKERKELKRITVAVGSFSWKQVSKEFSTGDADTIIVLCRFKQKEELVGAKAWFSNIKLEQLAQ